MSEWDLMSFTTSTVLCVHTNTENWTVANVLQSIYSAFDAVDVRHSERCSCYKLTVTELKPTNYCDNFGHWNLVTNEVASILRATPSILSFRSACSTNSNTFVQLCGNMRYSIRMCLFLAIILVVASVARWPNCLIDNVLAMVDGLRQKYISKFDYYYFWHWFRSNL